MPYRYSQSTMEKDLFILKMEFDAPITTYRLGTKKFYQIEDDYSFIQKLIEWANEGYQTIES